jgi:mannose-6-phosphate isomerase
VAPSIVSLDNPVKNYAWGSHTSIADLLGRPSPGNRPEAELWIGAHPVSPSRVAGPDGNGLDELIRRDPVGMLGPAVAGRFGSELPLLMKIVAAAEPLSIQCHPNRVQAERGFARENAQGLPLDSSERNYRDPHHKPELAVALTRFVGLKGFRPLDEIVRGLEALGLSELHDEVRRLAAGEEGGLRRFFTWLWSRPREERGPLVARAIGTARARRDDPAFSWMERLHAKYPGDIGVFAPLLLNLVELEPEDALYLPAGELHAYLEGTAIELMANSDNVLRGGLTPKHVDVAELLVVGAFRPAPPGAFRPVAVSPVERVYRTPAAEFELGLLDLAPGAPFAAPVERSGELLLALAGTAAVRAEGRSWPLARGQAVFVPAAVPSYRIEGEGRVARARVPPEC